MSDSAKNTWSTAPNIPKCGTTNKALQGRLSAVENALTEIQHTRSSQERIEFEIKAWEVQLLAEGGYNYIWLVSYTTAYHVSFQRTEVCTESPGHQRTVNGKHIVTSGDYMRFTVAIFQRIIAFMGM